MLAWQGQSMEIICRARQYCHLRFHKGCGQCTGQTDQDRVAGEQRIVLTRQLCANDKHKGLVVITNSTSLAVAFMVLAWHIAPRS